MTPSTPSTLSQRRGARVAGYLAAAGAGGLALAHLTVYTIGVTSPSPSPSASLFGPDRPGTYSLIAGPAFGVLAWTRR